MNIQIARIDTAKEPCHIVGFAITHQESGKSVYLDSFVPLSSVSDDVSKEELVKKAYDNIAASVQQFEKECTLQVSSIVGKRFDPTSGQIS
jgi:hypothetical protein